MKKFKKFFAVLLVTAMAATMLISCGGPKTSPEESATIFLDVIFKDDKTNMAKIGMDEEEYTKFKQDKENEMMQGFEGTGIDSSILTDEIKITLKNNVLKGLSTLSYEVTPVSTDKDTATVDVKIKVFDMEKITADGQSEIMEKVMSNPSMTEKEIYQESFKLIGEAIAAGTVKQESQTVTMTLTNEGNVWIPSENDVLNIMSTIMGE